MKTKVLGLDISKSTIDATIVFQGSDDNRHDSFLNNDFGFKQLFKWVSTIASPKEVLFCLEHTGYYSRSLCRFLDKNELEYALLNALSIKRSMGMRREKSDKYDSLIIARYGLKFYDELKPCSFLKGDLLELQLLLAHRKRTMDKELAYLRQEKHLKHCFKGDNKAQFVLSDLKKQRLFLQKHLLAIESKMDEVLTNNQILFDHYNLLITIPGVGKITAITTMVHTHNFKRINDPRKFSCYSGVAPFKNESGTSIRKGTRVSFYGNHKLKELLNFSALSAVRFDPQLKAYYQRKVEEGKNKMSVLNAVRNKIIHRMYATINRGTPYVIHPVFK